MKQFKDLGLSETALRALEQKGYTTPTEIQEKTIPILLEGKKDVIGESQTGSGKTAGFALPIIEKVNPNSKHVQAIVLAPTRELALQVAKEFESLRGSKKVYSLAVYGGTSIRDQLQKLRRGVHVIVGTPGRTLDLINRKALDLSHVSLAVLDEADEMLNMGFVEDIETILKFAPREKRMILFSATMPRQIMGITRKFMNNPVHVKLERKESSLKIEEYYYRIMSRDRFEGIRRVVDFNDDFYGIVFCNTKADVDSVTHQLLNANYKTAALHGDISQPQREKILLQFRKKQITVLVATDVAARGIDVDDLTHVVNFSLPQSPESYTHRIGRTGRAGKTGTAISFLIPSEKRKLRFIERIIKREIKEKKMPTIKDIISSKRNHMKTKVHTLIESGKAKKYEDFAQSLLKNHDPTAIISSLLKEAFSGVLDEGNYKELRAVSSREDRSGKSRDRKERTRRRPGSRREDRREKRQFEERDRRSPRKKGFRSESRGGRGRDRENSSRGSSRRERDNSKKERYGKKKKVAYAHKDSKPRGSYGKRKVVRKKR